MSDHKVKFRMVLELEYDNYGGHSIQEFEDILHEGITYLIDEGMISGHLEAILEDHSLEVTEIEDDEDDED